MPKVQSLEGLMVEEMRDLMDAEKQLTRALPKMARAAESEELRAGFEAHRRQTEGQIERLVQAFDAVGEKPRAKKCTGMRGLIEEGEEMMEEVPQGPVRDALLIASAQKVEHYEISSYGTLRTYANRLGHDRVARLFEATLEEEKATDKKLTELAEGMVNPQAQVRARAETSDDRPSRRPSQRSSRKQPTRSNSRGSGRRR